jgi:ribonuclease HI
MAETQRRTARPHLPRLDGRLLPRSSRTRLGDHGRQQGVGPNIAQGARNLGGQQTAVDAEVTAIELAVKWFLSQGRRLELRHMTVHSSAIARASHTGAGPCQTTARNIRNMVCELRGQGRTADLMWVKGHQGTPGNEKADVLAGQAAGNTGYSKPMKIAHLKLRISETFKTNKEEWHKSPDRHGTEEIPPPPPSEEVLSRRDAECSRPHCDSNPHRTLEIRRVPQADS